MTEFTLRGAALGLLLTTGLAGCASAPPPPKPVVAPTPSGALSDKARHEQQQGILKMRARTLRQRLLWAPLFGALLLLLADQVVQALAPLLGGEIPTGILTAFLGAPLLLVLLSRLHETRLNPPAARATAQVARLKRTSWILLAVLAIALFLALTWGRGP